MMGVRRFVAVGVLLALFALGGAARLDAGEDVTTGESKLFTEAMTAFVRGRIDEGVRQIMPLAGAGDASAQFIVGRLFEKGYGVAKDACEALKWYELAAVQDHADAIKQLGEFYHYGRCHSPDYDEAVRHYERSATLGDVSALLGLSHLYKEEDWDRYNPRLAFELAKRAWNTNYEETDSTTIEIAVSLGVSYHTGNVVDQDLKIAQKYHLFAAKYGGPLEQFLLSTLYTFNEDIFDFHEGAMWLLVSAEQGLNSVNPIRDGYADMVGTDKYDEVLQKARNTLREIASVEESAIGRAAVWCSSTMAASYECLRYAYNDHDACKSPIINEVLGVRYVDSERYDACRREAIETRE